MCRCFMMRGAETRRALRATKMGSGLPWPSGSSLRSHPASTGVMRSRGNSAWMRSQILEPRALPDVHRRRGAGDCFSNGSASAGMAKPMANAWPPKRVKRSAQDSTDIEQLKPINRAARAIGHAIFNADHDSGFGSAFDHARGEDADDAAMPAVAVEQPTVDRSRAPFHRPAMVSIAVSAAASVSRRSRFSRSSFAASSAARAASRVEKSR